MGMMDTPPCLRVNGSSKFLKSLTLLLVLMLGVGNVWGYQIAFKTGTGDGSNISTSTACSTIVSSGSDYLSGNVVTATKAYYNGSNGVKLGTSSDAGTLKMNLATKGQVTPTSIVVRAKRYSSSKATKIQINGKTAQNLTADFADYTFTDFTSAITYLEIKSSKGTSGGAYAWIESITINTASGTTVTLDPNYTGASTPYPTVTAENGKAMPSATLPVRTGYDFYGYYANQDGTGKSYYNENCESANNWDKTTATATIYAYWYQKTYEVSLDKNNYGEDDGAFSVEYNAAIDSKDFIGVEPTTGYDLLGYYTANSGGTKVVDANGNLVNSVEGWTTSDGKWIKDGADITLYAQYEVKTTKYAINLTQPTEATIAATPATAAADEEVTLSYSNVAAHYHFVSWSVLQGETPVDVTNNKFTMPEGEVTVSATFEKDAQHTVTFLNNGVEVVAYRKQVYEGEQIGELPAKGDMLPCDATSTTFMGWSTQTISGKQSANPVDVSTSTVVNDEMTLRAVWAKESNE